MRGVAVTVVLLVVLASHPTGASSGGSGLELVPTAGEARTFEPFEMAIKVEEPVEYKNPFDPAEVELSVRFTRAGEGKATVVPAFFGQPYERRRIDGRDWFYPQGRPVWRVRLAAEQPGRYEAVAILKDRRGSRQSKPYTFECRGSASQGFVRVSRKDPRFLEFTGGASFFAIGQNLAFIGSQQYVSLSKAEEIFAKLAGNGANYLRVWTSCEDWAMAIEARKSAFGRSWDWRPALAPLPGGSERHLSLTTARPMVQVSSSHPVALKPDTRYVMKGRVIAPEGGALEWVVHGSKAAPVTVPAGQGTHWSGIRHTWQTGPNDYWLGMTSLRLAGGTQAWVDGLSLSEAEGGPELLWEADLQRPIMGYYNPIDCFMLDELVNAARTNGVYLQLCLLTRDLYMNRLKDAASKEYAEAIEDAKRTLRYALGRWGYSTSVAAWEYWNEMDPGLPTDRFYRELGDYLAATDPYGHLRRTSTWGPSPRDCRHAALDVADVHFYLRPVDKGRIRDEVHAIQERTQWLRGQAPSKPIQMGEFGLADDKWGITEEAKRSPELVDAHNALWTSALSGACGTAMFWWWERLDQRDFYPHYRPLARFIADVPWNSGAVDLAEASLSEDDGKGEVVGLVAGQEAWVWVHNRQSTWANTVSANRKVETLSAAVLLLKDFPAGNYRAIWTSTQDGSLVLATEASATTTGDGLRMTVPAFTDDVACRVKPR